jgi:hypothetical protein
MMAIQYMISFGNGMINQCPPSSKKLYKCPCGTREM